jgi:TM2 domain-containing membrane protein YozV
MKDKTTAGLLAIFLGGLGIHRFYLGQAGLGFFHLLFCWFPVSWLIGFISGLVILTMDDDKFNLKYNPEHYRVVKRRQQESRESRREDRGQRREEERRRPQQTRTAPVRQAANQDKQQMLKKSGIDKYKDYDYQGAIEEFKKALALDPNDISIHFNLACTYSLNEEADKAFEHLDRAVTLGFTDFKRIKEHDALAYVRTQDAFDEFEANGFRLKQALPPKQTAPTQAQVAEEPVEDHSPILEQLQKLNELRLKGLLTEEEFDMQKRKLMN